MSAVATTSDQNALTGNIAASAATADSIAARIERLPISRWHTRIRIILGTATFFDAFDALTIAFVLPTLIGLWHLMPGQAGLLISTGFLGQLVGSIAFGWIGERYGRIFALKWSIIFCQSSG
jgi:putative MFS transporter